MYSIVSHKHASFTFEFFIKYLWSGIDTLLEVFYAIYFYDFLRIYNSKRRFLNTRRLLETLEYHIFPNNPSRIILKTIHFLSGFIRGKYQRRRILRDRIPRNEFLDEQMQSIMFMNEWYQPSTSCEQVIGKLLSVLELR